MDTTTTPNSRNSDDQSLITDGVAAKKKTPFDCKSEKEVEEMISELSNQEIFDWLYALSLLIVRGRLSLRD